MDTSHIRALGKPEHPWRMKLLSFIMRLCLAAYLTGKEADTMLGPAGMLLKRAFEVTRLSKPLLFSIIRHPNRLVGIGGQYVVIRSPKNDVVVKYSYTLAGADKIVLNRTRSTYTNEFNRMQQQFGALAQPTVYSLAYLPLRWPFNRLTTLTASQPLLDNYVDIFSPSAAQLLLDQPESLREDLNYLTKQAQKWSKRNKWIDIIGPNNVVITNVSTDPHIRIIDTEPYVPEYLEEVNPVIGKPYREVFADKLKKLESFASILFIVLSTLLILQVFRVHHFHCLVNEATIALKR